MGCPPSRGRISCRSIGSTIGVVPTREPREAQRRWLLLGAAALGCGAGPAKPAEVAGSTSDLHIDFEERASEWLLLLAVEVWLNGRSAGRWSAKGMEPDSRRRAQLAAHNRTMNLARLEVRAGEHRASLAVEYQGNELHVGGSIDGVVTVRSEHTFHVAQGRGPSRLIATEYTRTDNRIIELRLDTRWAFLQG